MDQHLRELIDQVALRDGGCSMSLNTEITGSRTVWALGTTNGLELGAGLSRFEQLTVALVSGDFSMVIGHATTMN